MNRRYDVIMNETLQLVRYGTNIDPHNVELMYVFERKDYLHRIKDLQRVEQEHYRSMSSGSGSRK